MRAAKELFGLTNSMLAYSLRFISLSTKAPVKRQQRCKGLAIISWLHTALYLHTISSLVSCLYVDNGESLLLMWSNSFKVLRQILIVLEKCVWMIRWCWAVGSKEQMAA